MTIPSVNNNLGITRTPINADPARGGENTTSITQQVAQPKCQILYDSAKKTYFFTKEIFDEFSEEIRVDKNSNKKFKCEQEIVEFVMNYELNKVPTQRDIQKKISKIDLGFSRSPIQHTYAKYDFLYEFHGSKLIAFFKEKGVEIITGDFSKRSSLFTEAELRNAKMEQTTAVLGPNGAITVPRLTSRDLTKGKYFDSPFINVDDGIKEKANQLGLNKTGLTFKVFYDGIKNIYFFDYKFFNDFVKVMRSLGLRSQVQEQIGRNIEQRLIESLLIYCSQADKNKEMGNLKTFKEHFRDQLSNNGIKRTDEVSRKILANVYKVQLRDKGNRPHFLQNLLDIGLVVVPAPYTEGFHTAAKPLIMPSSEPEKEREIFLILCQISVCYIQRSLNLYMSLKIKKCFQRLCQI